jgi:CelD/BcsL family acetyltransferase involved in cellulose biosynthesis
MQAYRIEQLHSIDSQVWETLVKISPTQTIFQSFGWHKAWWETFSSDKKLFLIGIKDNEKLCGLAPLALFSKGRHTILKFMGTGHSDYCDFLYPIKETAIFEELFKYLVRNKEWDEIALDYIVDDSKSLNLLSKNCQNDNLYLHPYSQIACPRLQIHKDKDTIKNILNKKSLRRHHKYFTNRGDYKVEHLTKEEEIACHLNDFFKQHIKR